jgi:uncharacterized small protein (DUF1192 family)
VEALLHLVKHRITELKKTRGSDVVVALRAEIARLSAEHKREGKEEGATEALLKQLWEELYEIDPSARPDKATKGASAAAPNPKS